jgi:hypothetical protein
VPRVYDNSQRFITKNSMTKSPRSSNATGSRR